MEVQFLLVYFPNDEEKRNSMHFAENVSQVMVNNPLNLLSQDLTILFTGKKETLPSLKSSHWSWENA